MEIHFIDAGEHDWDPYENLNTKKLISFISAGMKLYKIKQVMFTNIYMRRYNLITKEKMENYCKGKEDKKESVNDDLESLFQDIQSGKELNVVNHTYFLPKLTQKELKLAEQKDLLYSKTFKWNLLHFDVDETEMLMSESKSKFACGGCHRQIFKIENP